MKFTRIWLIAIYTLACQSRAESSGSFTQELERAIKESPPGDYPSSNPGSETQTEIIIRNHGSRDSKDTISLIDLRISELTLDESTPIEAFELLQSKLEGQKRIAFTLDVLKDAARLSTRYSLIMTDIPASEAANYICTLFGLDYNVVGQILLIKERQSAEQGAAANP